MSLTLYISKTYSKLVCGYVYMYTRTNTHTTVPPGSGRGRPVSLPRVWVLGVRAVKAFGAEGLAEARNLPRREEWLGWATKELHAVNAREGGRGQP